MLRHILKIDGLAIFTRHPDVTVPGIVPETVLNTDDDPVYIIRTVC